LTQEVDRLNLSSTDWNWLFIGLVGPLLPAMVAGMIAWAKQYVPTYGPLVLLAIASVLFTALLARTQVFKESHRKALKAGLDTA